MDSRLEQLVEQSHPHGVQIDEGLAAVPRNYLPLREVLQGAGLSDEQCKEALAPTPTTEGDPEDQSTNTVAAVGLMVLAFAVIAFLVIAVKLIGFKACLAKLSQRRFHRPIRFEDDMSVVAPDVVGLPGTRA